MAAPQCDYVYASPSTSGCLCLQAFDPIDRAPRVDNPGGISRSPVLDFGLREDVSWTGGLESFMTRCCETCLAGEVCEGEKDAGVHRSCGEDSRKGQEAGMGEAEDGVRRTSRYVAQEIRRPTVKIESSLDSGGS